MVKIAEEKKDKIVDLRRKGYGYRTIAKETGVSLDTAHRHGKNVQMEEDRRYRRNKELKDAVKKETKRLVGVNQIKPSHQDKFDRLISENVDRAIKSLAQACGLTSNRFVGLFGFGRSLANIAFDAEESETYCVFPILRNLFFGEQKLPAIPLRRMIFVRRISRDIAFFKWDEIKEMEEREGNIRTIPKKRVGGLGVTLLPPRGRAKERRALV